VERTLEYINESRGGYIIYKDDQGELKLYFEYGGGKCVVIINVPGEEEWKSKTNRSLTDRNSVLTYIAERSIKDKAPDCYFKLHADYIEIVEK
jgi:hypothetical protein